MQAGRGIAGSPANEIGQDGPQGAASGCPSMTLAVRGATTVLFRSGGDKGSGIAQSDAGIRVKGRLRVDRYPPLYGRSSPAASLPAHASLAP